MKMRRNMLLLIVPIVAGCGGDVLEFRNAEGGVELVYQCSAPEFGNLTSEGQKLLTKEAGRAVRLETERAQLLRVSGIEKAFQESDPDALERAIVEYGCTYGLVGRPRFPEVGSAPPAYTLTPLDGADVSGWGQGDSSQDRGRPVILIFWASWCGPCQTGYSELQALAREADSAGVPVYAIVHRDTPANVRRWIGENGGGVTFMIDEGGRVARDYGVHGLPTTFVIGEDGLIRLAGMGYAGSESVLGLLNAALQEAAPGR